MTDKPRSASEVPARHADEPPSPREDARAARRVSQWDVTWRRPNLSAGLVLAALAAAALAANLSLRNADVLRSTRSPGDAAIPIDDDNARLAALRLDPNTATAAQLQLLPEVGPILAQKIVDTRETLQRAGIDRPFRRPSDLNKVPGIGPKTIRRFAEHLELPE